MMATDGSELPVVPGPLTKLPLRTPRSPVTQRPLVLWFLDHDLDPDVLRFQIRAMKTRGFGGFFMHWISGGEPYLGERWLRALEVMAEEAEATGLEAWLYDEAWCPSCFAGGRCLARDPELQLRTLHTVVREAAPGKWGVSVGMLGEVPNRRTNMNCPSGRGEPHEA